MRKKPVIIDTDIGTDIDDTWALVMALNSPELDIRLIVSATGDTFLRASMIAKLLERCGRTDIPIGIGIPMGTSQYYQKEWVEKYDLSRFPGRIIEDGVGAVIETIKASKEEVTIIGMAPLPNISSALKREPAMVNNARFVGMQGSIYRGYFGKEGAAAEFNVVKFPQACREVFSAPWNVAITPLDTCGLVKLKGDGYQLVSQSDTPGMAAVMENYRVWTKYNDHPQYHGFDPKIESSILYDTVAVYMAFSEDLLVFEDLGIRVSDDGHTLVDSGKKKIHCALRWKDQGAFEDLLMQRLLLD